MRGDLEPVRGNLRVCKFVRELTNIQIRTVTAEQNCVPSAFAQRTCYNSTKEGSKQAKQRKGRKEGRKAGENQKWREKEGRKEIKGESEREGTATEREGESARFNTP